MIIIEKLIGGTASKGPPFKPCQWSSPAEIEPNPTHYSAAPHLYGVNGALVCSAVPRVSELAVASGDSGQRRLS